MKWPKGVRALLQVQQECSQTTGPFSITSPNRDFISQLVLPRPVPLMTRNRNPILCNGKQHEEANDSSFWKAQLIYCIFPWDGLLGVYWSWKCSRRKMTFISLWTPCRLLGGLHLRPERFQETPLQDMNLTDIVSACFTNKCRHFLNINLRICRLVSYKDDL